MNLRRSTLPAGGLAGFLTLLLLVPPAFGQAGGATTTAADPAAPSLRDLQEQIQALSSDVRAMKAEVEDARAQAARLRQELQSTSEQLQVLQGQLAETQGQAGMAAAPQAPAAAASAYDRVSKVEEDQQLLHSEVDTLAQTKVESGSKYRVRLSGVAIFDAFSTRGNLANYDLPTFAQPATPGETNSTLGASVRQSIMGLDVYGPDIFGASTRADIRADFFGGFPGSPEGITTGIVRLRTAGVHLDWQNTSVVVGQYDPLVSPLSPTSLVSTGYPALSSAGNLWVWTPEAYIEHRFGLGDGSKLIVEGGIMDSLSGQPPMASPYRDAQPGEQSGQPAYAGRVAWSNGSQGAQIGVGGYYALQNWGWGQKVNSYAVTADWNAPLGHWFALSGEFYHGRALGGLGAADGQSVAATGYIGQPGTVVRGLNSTGGWAQLKFMANERLEFNGAFGEDFSVPPGLGYLASGTPYVNGYAPLGRNESVFFNTIYHLRSNLLLSTEYRRLRTSDSQPGIFSGNVVSLGAAALF